MGNTPPIRRPNGNYHISNNQPTPRRRQSQENLITLNFEDIASRSSTSHEEASSRLSHTLNDQTPYSENTSPQETEINLTLPVIDATEKPKKKLTNKIVFSCGSTIFTFNGRSTSINAAFFCAILISLKSFLTMMYSVDQMQPS